MCIPLHHHLISQYAAVPFLKTRNRNRDCWILMNHYTINLTQISALFDHRGVPSEIADPGDNNWEGWQRLLCIGDGNWWFECTLKYCVFLRHCLYEWSHNTVTYRHPWQYDLHVGWRWCRCDALKWIQQGVGMMFRCTVHTAVFCL